MDIERIKELLSYDPDTGVLRWRVDRVNGAKAGTIAGSKSAKGYIVVGVDGSYYQGHRIENLRSATYSQNAANRAPVAKLGRKGVFFRHEIGKYRVLITVDGKKRHVGYFDDPEFAELVYDSAADRLYGSYNYKGGATVHP